MAEKKMDENEYKFPDEQQDDKNADGQVSAGEAEEIVEVVDDTPEADRGRQPIGKTADEVAPDDEVAAYSENVQKRIKELKRTWHDERREKEAAQRERDEAVRSARYYYEQAQKAGANAQQAQQYSLSQMKDAAAKALEAAERDLETAYESGDSKAVVKATKAVSEAQFKIARAQALENAPRPQQQQPPLQQPQQRVQSEPTPQASIASSRAQQWQTENKWYGNDEEMTSFALGVHQKLVRQGVVPDSDDYYAKLNKRIRDVFPDQFAEDADDGEETGTPAQRKTPATVVAPASRSSNAAPKKVQITKTAASLAAKLGISVQEYARQVKLLEKQDRAKNG
jgi:hypothetical protein